MDNIEINKEISQKIEIEKVLENLTIAERKNIVKEKKVIITDKEKKDI